MARLNLQSNAQRVDVKINIKHIPYECDYYDDVDSLTEHMFDSWHKAFTHHEPHIGTESAIVVANTIVKGYTLKQFEIEVEFVVKYSTPRA